jgi:hypothetical protein
MGDDAEDGRPDEEPDGQEWQGGDPLDRVLNDDEGGAEEECREHQCRVRLPARRRDRRRIGTFVRREWYGGLGHGTSHQAFTPGLAVLPILAA